MHRILILISFLYLFVLAASAQTTDRTRITGTVMDASSGEMLPGATLFVKEANKGITTDGKGKFTLDGLSAGNYTLQISFIGFQTQTRELTLTKGEAKKMAIELIPVSQSLQEVTITAKSEARKLRESAMPVSIISMGQLQGTVSNVSDVLNKTVGVTIRNSGGTGAAARISVRGLEGKRIGFFIEETPMNDHSDFMDINDIPTEMIDRIEIYKGVVPAKFGGSAMGGAVNLVIKEYPPKYFDFNYSTGSYNTHKINAVFKRNLANKGLELGLGGFYTYSDNNYKMKSPFEEGRIIKRDHDRYEKITVAGGLTARKWYFDKVKFEPVYVRTNKDIQGIEYNIQKAHSMSDLFALETATEKRNFLVDGLDLDFDLAGAYTIFQFVDTSAVRYNWDGTTYPAVSKYGGEIGKTASESYNKKTIIINKLNLNYVLDKHNSLNFNSLFNYAKGDPKDEVKDKVIGYRTNFKSKMASWVTGLTYDYRSTNDKWLNSLTAKYYLYSMQTKLASILSTQVKDVDMSKSDYGVSDALRYRLTKDFMLKLSAAYDVRLPSETELLGDGYLIAPAADLLPERTTNCNIGFLFDLTGKKASNLQIEVNAFYNYLEDMIRYTGGFLQSQYQNFGEMRSLGIEAEVKADITNWLYGYANITYQDLRDTRKYEPNTMIPNPTKGSRMPNIPYLLANAGVEFHKENLLGGKGQNTRIYTDVSFVEEYLYDFEQNKQLQRRIPRTTSVNLGFEHSFFNQSLFLSGKVNNLTDTAMMSEFNHPLPGRNFTIKLRYVMKHL